MGFASHAKDILCLPDLRRSRMTPCDLFPTRQSWNTKENQLSNIEGWMSCWASEQRKGNRGPERLSSLPEVMQLGSGRAQALGFQSP